MPRRRVVGIGAAAVAAVALSIAVIVLVAGPDRQVTRSYVSSHTFRSAVAGACVETTARGVVTATRGGTAPLVRWTDVHLIDPSMSVAAYELVADRCDHTHRISLAATLQQNWSTDGSTPVSRQSDEGPVTGALRQFNSGTPIHLPSRAFPASLFGSDYPIDGQILIDARFPSVSEGFGYRTHLTLDASRSP